MREYGLMSAEPELRRGGTVPLRAWGRANERGVSQSAFHLSLKGETIELRGQSARGDPSFEAVDIEEGSSFTSARLSQDNLGGHNAWHYHPELELCWVKHGQGRRFIGDNIEHFEAGDLVLIGPNLPHCYQHDDTGVAVGARLPERVVLHFSPDMFGQGFFELAETRIIGALLRNCDYGWHVRGGSADRVRNLMENMLEKKALPRLINLLEILETLARAGDDLRSLASQEYLVRSANRANSQRIEAIRKYVRENLSEDINQAHASNLVGLTPSAFSRFFRKATGRTFVQFVNHVRINEACRLLVETDLGVTEIAFSCGYWSIANFNRQFLRIKQMNPTQFREKGIQSLIHRHNGSPASGVRTRAAPAQEHGVLVPAS